MRKVVACLLMVPGALFAQHMGPSPLPRISDGQFTVGSLLVWIILIVLVGWAVYELYRFFTSD